MRSLCKEGELNPRNLSFFKQFLLLERLNVFFQIFFLTWEKCNNQELEWEEIEEYRLIFFCCF